MQSVSLYLSMRRQSRGTPDPFISISAHTHTHRAPAAVKNGCGRFLAGDGGPDAAGRARALARRGARLAARLCQPLDGPGAGRLRVPGLLLRGLGRRDAQAEPFHEGLRERDAVGRAGGGAVKREKKENDVFFVSFLFFSREWATCHKPPLLQSLSFLPEEKEKNSFHFFFSFRVPRGFLLLLCVFSCYLLYCNCICLFLRCLGFSRKGKNKTQTSNISYQLTIIKIEAKISLSISSSLSKAMCTNAFFNFTKKQLS